MCYSLYFTNPAGVCQYLGQYLLGKERKKLGREQKTVATAVKDRDLKRDAGGSVFPWESCQWAALKCRRAGISTQWKNPITGFLIGSSQEGKFFCLYSLCALTPV